MPLCTNTIINANSSYDASYAAGIAGSYMVSSNGFNLDIGGNFHYQENVPYPGMPSSGQQFMSIFKNIGQSLDIDWRLVAALAYQESNFNEKIGPNSSSCCGLFQFRQYEIVDGVTKWYWTSSDGDIFNATDQMNKLIPKWKGFKKNAATAQTYNDVVLLVMQAHHDGNVKQPATTWANRKHQKTSKEGLAEENSYISYILGYYRQFCGTAR